MTLSAIHSDAMPQAPWWLVLLLFVPLFLGTTFLGYEFYLTPESVSAFWAASGVLLGFLLITRFWLWVPILALSQVCNMGVAYIVGNEQTIGFADFSTEAEALLGASLIRWISKPDLSITSLSSLLLLIGAGAIVAPGLASLWGSYNFVDVQSNVAYLSAWQVWWFADGLGVLVATPFILVWFSSRGPIRRLKEGVLFLSVLALSLLLVMGGAPEPFRSVLDFPYVVVPAMVWIALRCDTRLVTTANVLLAVGTVWATVQGFGPFVLTVTESVQANVLAIQTFLVTMIVGTALLHAAQIENRLANREKTRLLEASYRGQKLEVLGRMAAGVSHNFNNDLMVIQGQIDLLRTRNANNENLTSALDAIDRAAERSSEKIRLLLDFGGSRSLEPTDVEVDRLLHDLLPSIQTAAGSHVTVELHTNTNQAHVRLDTSGFEQSILNLVINARDAIHSVGRVEITTRCEWHDATLRGGTDSGDSGEMLQVCIQDNGGGMSEEARTRAGEPFFTTKPVGVGTGMGLASVYGFVRDVGGWIDVNSELGKGTTVRLMFPIPQASHFS